MNGPMDHTVVCTSRNSSVEAGIAVMSHIGLEPQRAGGPVSNIVVGCEAVTDVT